MLPFGDHSPRLPTGSAPFNFEMGPYFTRSENDAMHQSVLLYYIHLQNLRHNRRSVYHTFSQASQLDV